MSVKEKTRRLNIIISESLHEQLSELVEKHDESKSGFIRLAVELAPLYESDEELTAFTSLDSEDFL